MIGMNAFGVAGLARGAGSLHAAVWQRKDAAAAAATDASVHRGSP